MPQELENTGSAARDFAMLERNLLSHVRLAALLALLAFSLLLDARLPSDSDLSSAETPASSANTPLAALQMVSCFAALAAGVWEYHQGYKDMRELRGFLSASR